MVHDFSGKKWNPYHTSDGVRAFRHTEQTLANSKLTNIPSIVVFFFRLPFNLTLPDEANLVLRKSLDQSEPPWVELTVHRVRISLASATFSPYDSGLAVILGEELPALESEGSSAQTWVAASTISVLFEDENFDLANREGAFTSIAFERCLSAVNRLISAEHLRTGNHWSHTVSKEALDREISYFLVDLKTGEFGKRRSLKLHNRPYNPIPVSRDPNLLHHIHETLIFRLSSDATPNAHPMIVARELAASAMASVYAGDSFPPILLLQASAERFLRGVLRMLLIDQHIREREVNSQADLAPFATILKGSIVKILGGDWSSSLSPISIYKRDLYEPRNSILHRGQTASWEKLNPAIAAHDNLIEFVENRIVKCWRKAPRTLLCISEPAIGGKIKVPVLAVKMLKKMSLEVVPYWLADDTANRSLKL